jgi:hypothetical protein
VLQAMTRLGLRPRTRRRTSPISRWPSWSKRRARVYISPRRLSYLAFLDRIWRATHPTPSDYSPSTIQFQCLGTLFLHLQSFLLVRSGLRLGSLGHAVLSSLVLVFLVLLMSLAMFVDVCLLDGHRGLCTSCSVFGCTRSGAAVERCLMSGTRISVLVFLFSVHEFDGFNLLVGSLS